MHLYDQHGNFLLNLELKLCVTIRTYFVYEKEKINSECEEIILTLVFSHSVAAVSFFFYKKGVCDISTDLIFLTY